MGWADFRVTDYQQIERWWEIVMSAFTFHRLKRWLSVFSIPALSEGFTRLIQYMQQFYCPVVRDLLLRRILFSSAQMMKKG